MTNTMSNRVIGEMVDSFLAKKGQENGWKVPSIVQVGCSTLEELLRHENMAKHGTIVVKKLLDVLATYQNEENASMIASRFVNMVNEPLIYSKFADVLGMYSEDAACIINIQICVVDLIGARQFQDERPPNIKGYQRQIERANTALDFLLDKKTAEIVGLYKGRVAKELVGEVLSLYLNDDPMKAKGMLSFFKDEATRKIMAKYKESAAERLVTEFYITCRDKDLETAKTLFSLFGEDASAPVVGKYSDETAGSLVFRVADRIRDVDGNIANARQILSILGEDKHVQLIEEYSYKSHDQEFMGAITEAPVEHIGRIREMLDFMGEENTRRVLGRYKTEEFLKDSHYSKFAGYLASIGIRDIPTARRLLANIDKYNIPIESDNIWALRVILDKVEEIIKRDATLASKLVEMSCKYELDQAYSMVVAVSDVATHAPEVALKLLSLYERYKMDAVNDIAARVKKVVSKDTALGNLFLETITSYDEDIARSVAKGISEVAERNMPLAKVLIETPQLIKDDPKAYLLLIVQAKVHTVS